MASPTPFRTSTRERRAKQLDGYVDASFSETEEPLLYSPPSPPSTLVGISGRSVSNDSLRSPPAKRGPPKCIPHPRPWKPSPQNLNNFSQYRTHTSKPTTVPCIAAQKEIADVTKKSAAVPRQSAVVPGLNASDVAKKPVAAPSKSTAAPRKLAVVPGLPNCPKTTSVNKRNIPSVKNQNISKNQVKKIDGNLTIHDELYGPENACSAAEEFTNMENLSFDIDTVNPDNQRRNANQHSSSVQNVEDCPNWNDEPYLDEHLDEAFSQTDSAPLSYPDIGTCPIQIPLKEVSLVRNDQRKPQHYFPVSEAHRTRPAIEQRAQAENREGEAIRSKRDSNSDQDFRSYAKRNFEYIKVHLRELTSADETLTLAVNQRDVTDKLEDTANISGFEFPFNDIETMKELENLLSTGDVVLLGRVGGDVVSSTTYRVMAKLMTNRLGTEITWTGRSKPNEFKHKMLDMPRIFAAICDAVRFHPRLKEATDYNKCTLR
ncbi:hypothetical protein OUZ56_005644 [Daphnia magna]|uniref:DUF4806 domain-containing protein n=1 Tax=Daphnia magna TaxID=35525 RepID=A0ABQ9YTC5_9CRUS|nr:hypothetical protein OUZ56_005644 [Daphnia magna]